MTPRIAGVGTAVPPHVVAQAQAREFARGFFGPELPETERLLSAFLNTGIETRHLARPPDWYARPHDFTEKNAVYREVALELAQQAAERALAAATLDPRDIGAILFVSTTGISTPSLDARLVQTLGLSRSIARVPIWGLGCGGGAAGLARAGALVRGTGRPALVVSVELCSVTFVHGDRSKQNLIATALFGDGAGAAVVTPDGTGPALLGGHSRLLDDTEDVMGWRLGTEGLQVVFSRSIPGIVREIVPGLVREAAAAAGLSPADLRHFVVHPGGAKVLAAYADALDLDTAALVHARTVLRDFGNMSSPTVLFVLERFLREQPRRDEAGLLIALGPGFSAESVPFRW